MSPSAEEICERNKLRIAFSWNGLPQYAARLLRKAIDALGDDCIVIGSRPSVPVEGMEAALGQPIYWVDAAAQTSWAALGIPVPDLFFQSGWGYPAFNSLGLEVRRGGGRVVGFCDANFRSNFRQLVLGAIWFRLAHRRRFDAMIVPGSSGERLMRYFGMPGSRIFHGMYGADPSLFTAGLPLAERPKRFLFVGQFIARKDVLGLARAFVRLRHIRPEWELVILGGGEQADAIPRGEGITVGDFVQPEQLGTVFRDARFFVLPSLEEAWGLVVHEAALSGCGLLLSNAIGSADDLGTTALRFRAGDEDALLSALLAATDLDTDDLTRRQTEALRVARQFGPQRFAKAVQAAMAAVA